MPQFILTARNNIPLGAGQIVERGREIVVCVNSPSALPSNIFNTQAGKEAVGRAFSLAGIPPSANFMTMAKWDVKPFMPRF